MGGFVLDCTKVSAVINPEMTCEGFDELRAKLRQLSTDQADRIMNAALREGAAVFQQEEAARAPERPELPSTTALPPGALRADVTIRKIPNQSVYLIGPGKYTRHAARLVELGHRMVRGGRNRLLKNGKTRGRGQVTGIVPPHPYIRPAFEGASATAQDAIRRSLQLSISRINSPVSGSSTSIEVTEGTE